ncbi:serpin family protein [candidate division KSB1 bacterium]
MILNRILLLILTVALYVSCTHTDSTLLAPQVPLDLNRKLTTAEENLVHADNSFAFKLLKAVNDEETALEEAGNNFLISPLSVSMALGMTLNGADGETKEEMQNTLELQGMSQDDINRSYESLMDLLTQVDKDVIMDIANSVWIREGFPVEQDFIDVNVNYFDSYVSSLDFSAPAASDIINGWVYDNTGGKIDKIVPDQIDIYVMLYLINAVYFKGAWTYPFDADNTAEAPFYVPGGPARNAQFMIRYGPVRHFTNEQFLAVDIPYGADYYSMVILMPTEPGSIDAVIAGAQSSDWALWVDSFIEQPDTEFRMPKFKMEYEISLKDVLSSLGMRDAFAESADFSRINPDAELFISEVKHKTYIDVNEEGTEAAAATSVEISLTSIRPSIIIDRPFLFFIRESKTGAIIFAGKMLDPEY